MEKKLKALCAKHGLYSISISVWPNRNRAFSVFVHPDMNSCAMGDGATVAEAVEAAVLDLRSRRAA